MLGVVLFVGANLYSYNMAEPPCCDFYASFGFPLPLGTVGGFAGNGGVLWSGLIADTLIGVCTSLVSGWVFAKSLPAITNLFRRTARWHVSTRS